MRKVVEYTCMRVYLSIPSDYIVSVPIVRVQAYMFAQYACMQHLERDATDLLCTCNCWSLFITTPRTRWNPQDNIP